MKTSFGDFVALARDRTPAGRRRFASEFAEAFMNSPGTFNEGERVMALNILSTLMQDAALEVRQMLSERLARETGVPQKLLQALANDLIDVARPILQFSVDLREEDIKVIIESKTTQHRQALATRTVLSAEISEALVEKGEVVVALTLLDNMELHISESTMRKLASQALSHNEIGDHISGRSELTSEVAEKIYWIISTELRTQITSRFTISEDKLNRALGDVVSALVTRQLQPGQRRSVAERLVATGRVDAVMLIELLKGKGIDLFRELLGHLTKFKPSLVEALCSETGAEPLALVCRALGYNKTDTASLIMLVQDRIAGQSQFNPAQIARAIELYNALTLGDARTVLWQWQSDPSYLFALTSRRPN